MGKQGMEDSGKEIREAEWVEAWVMEVRVLRRVVEVERRWGEMWAVAMRRVGRGIVYKG